MVATSKYSGNDGESSWLAGAFGALAAASHNEVKTLFLLPNYLNLFAVIASALPLELMDLRIAMLSAGGVYITVYISRAGLFL